MKKELLGTIRLAPGEVGYFDELTRIHLTIARPTAHIYAGMNTTNIKKSVRSGGLLLVSGTLEPKADVDEAKIETKATKKAEEKVAKAKVEEKSKASKKAVKE